MIMLSQLLRMTKLATTQRSLSAIECKKKKENTRRCGHGGVAETTRQSSKKAPRRPGIHCHFALCCKIEIYIGTLNWHWHGHWHGHQNWQSVLRNSSVPVVCLAHFHCFCCGVAQPFFFCARLGLCSLFGVAETITQVLSFLWC